MENLTRREIERCFLALLQEKDVEKVTVSDIAARCGINRNTFYYHFRDIPSLLESLSRETVEYFFRDMPPDISLSEALGRFYACLEENRQLIGGMFSLSWRNVDRRGFIGSLCGSVAGWLVGIIGGEQRLSKVQADVVVEILKCEFIGQIVQWVDSGFSYDMKEYGLKICREIKTFI
ncbi:MAG: TetR/AcrR family transcriptional regulator [Treponema sp.]|nr:TetR/AcrR family transcriptional regulator [Treponema sp.]